MISMSVFAIYDSIGEHYRFQLQKMLKREILFPHPLAGSTKKPP
jgi:hypothetical protein